MTRAPTCSLRSPAHTHILDVRIDNVSVLESVALIEQMLEEQSLHQVATVNPEFVVLAQKNLLFRQVLNSTSLNVPDGVGLLWAARRMGSPFKERVAGQELVAALSARAALQGWRLFLLGAREGIAAKAATVLCNSYPKLQIVGCWSGSPSPEEDVEITQRVNDSGANIVLVAYGPPRQEIWIARNAHRLQAQVAVGVGGTFDTLAGLVPRAPAWMRRAGFEWTYRLIREPRRLRRQLAIPYFMWLVFSRQKQNEPVQD